MMRQRMKPLGAHWARSSAKARRASWRLADRCAAASSLAVPTSTSDSRASSTSRTAQWRIPGLQMQVSMQGAVLATSLACVPRGVWVGNSVSLDRRSLSTTVLSSSNDKNGGSEAVFSDDDVILTPRCAERLAELTEQRGKKIRLRLAVEGGGCSGFSYVFELEDSAPGEDDITFARGDSELIVDDSSIEFLRGATVDFAEDLLRSSFAVINNPNSASSCGCGSSFMAKDWEE